jgi:hypothetical protein
MSGPHERAKRCVGLLGVPLVVLTVPLTFRNPVAHDPEPEEEEA